MSNWLLYLVGFSANPSPSVEPTVSSIVLSVAFIAILVGKEVSAVYPRVDELIADALDAALLPTLIGFAAVVFVQASQII